MMKKLTIVTVCWNSASTIEKCIRSVAEQRNASIEHIIVDGQSQDDTLKTIENVDGWEGKIISEPDNGIYDAMNKGLKLATGEYVGFLNSDDFLADPLCAASLVSAFDELEADVVMADIRIGGKDGSRFPRFYSGGGYWPLKLRMGYAPPHPGFYAKRNVLRKFGGFSTHFKSAADFELILKLHLSKEVKLVHLPRVVVEMANGGVSTAGFSSKVQNNKELIEACRRNNFYTNSALIWVKNLLKLTQYLPRQNLR